MSQEKGAKWSIGSMAIILGLFLASATAFAQSGPPAPPSEDGTRLYPNATSTVRVVATASIQNSSLSPIGEAAAGGYRVAFDMMNGQQVQTGVRFGLRLTRENGNSQELVDEKTFPGEHSFTSGERRRIEAEYAPPAFVKGELTPWIVAKTSGGIVIGLSKLPDIQLAGSGEQVDVPASGCYLRVTGSDERYTPLQGVDISAAESLTAVCAADSGFAESAPFNVSLSAFERSAYGERIDIGSVAQSVVTLKPGKQTFEFAMPKFNEAQAYHVVMKLENGGKAVSNSVDFHFVVQGPSATIQNIRLDKEGYEKGETALVSLYWTGAADDFYGSRSGGSAAAGLTAVTKVVSASGDACSDEVRTALEGPSGEEAIEVAMKRRCDSPSISLALVDANGAVLDQKTVATGDADAVPTKERRGSVVPWAIAIILAIGALFGWLYGRRSGGGPKAPAGTIAAVFLAAVIGIAVFGGGATAVSAAGATYEVDWHIPGVLWDKVSYYVALDKDNYMPGENVVMTATSGVKPMCGNGSYTMVYLHEFPGIATYPPIYVVYGFVNYRVKDANFSGSNTQKAPTTPGTYNAVFKVRYYHHGYFFEELLTVPFTVGAPPQPSNVTAMCPAPGNAVTVNWTPVSGFGNYYVRIHDEDTNTPAAYSPLVTGSSYTWNGAVPGKTYSYWVHTANSDGTLWSAPLPDFRSATVACPLPPSPTNMTGSCPAPGTSATMTWTAPTGYTNFAPRLCDKTMNPTCDPYAAGFWRNDDLAATTWTVGGLTPGHTYGAWVHTVGNPNPATAPDFSCPLAPACGTAAKTYPNNSTGFGSDTFCSVGSLTSSAPAFPGEDEGSVWTCTNAGVSSTCSAYREGPSVSQGFTLVADPALLRGKKTGITGTHSESNASSVKVVPYGGFTGQVTLTAEMPVGAAEPIILPNKVNSPGYTASLFVKIPGKAPNGTYEVIVTGKSGARTATTSVWVDISDGTGGQI